MNRWKESMNFVCRKYNNPFFRKKRVLLRNVRDAHALRSVLCYHSKYA
jgi:hypothetical protein